MAGGADDDDLARYRSKRGFERSDEPSAARPGGDADEANRFVVQHHDASTEHDDLRLEHDGVLLSWAVPKGPSTDPRDERLAVRTEDHPVDYADFEGSIPADEYGGGSVIVWDRGTWENTTTGDDGPVDVDAALADGHLSFTVEACKLQGGYVLQRFRPEEDQWLLVKRDDDGADARRNPTSTLVDEVVDGPEWIAERKLDGIRLIGVRDGDVVELWTPNHLERSATHPELVDALRTQPSDAFVVDGEVVAFDGDVTSFGRLQQRSGITDPDEARRSGVAVVLYPFDLVHLDGQDLRERPLRARKSALHDGLRFADPRRFCAHRNGAGRELLEDACSRLRHPRYLGLRHDKDAADVVRERARGAP